MHKKILFLFLLSIFFVGYSNAQENDIESSKGRLLIGAESGVSLFFPQSPEYEFIRGDVLPFSSAGASESLKANAFGRFVGIKAELRDKSNLWGFLAGLRYTKISSTLGKNDADGSSSSYFYFLDQQNVEITEYFRVKEVKRNVEYIGIPVEIRRLFYNDRSFKFYVKLGAEFNYKISSSSEVEFRNENMWEYSNNVLSKFEEPEPFYSAVAVSAGINYDKLPNVDFEVTLPYIVLTPASSGIISNYAGIGFKIEVKLPTRKK